MSSEAAGDRVVVSVADNGIGIAEDKWQEIFGLFNRLHRDDELEGTGMGLAYCKKVVELHHGDIWVESELGKGSVFKFSLPIAR